MNEDFKRVVIALDLSMPSREAAEVGLRLAAALGARARFVHVVKPLRQMYLLPDYKTTKIYFGADIERKVFEANAEAAEKEFEYFKKLAKQRGVEFESSLREGDPVDELLLEAEAADLLVVGSTGRGQVKKLRLGTVTRALLKKATCPVTHVRSRDD